MEFRLVRFRSILAIQNLGPGYFGLFPYPVKRHALYRERSGAAACYSHFAYGKAALLRIRLIDRQLQRSMLKGGVGISVLRNQDRGQQFGSGLLAVHLLLSLQKKGTFLNIASCE